MIRIGRLRRRIGKMGMTMTAEAVEVRKIYQREYRRRNRDKINSQRKNWRAENRDRVRRYNRQYWERRAQSSKDTRASYEDYGITPERLRELMEIAKSEKHAGTVLDAALKADRLAAGHIILSVTDGISYDHLEYHEKLGRCPLGRTDFYGARRLFFHYLDCALKERQETENSIPIKEKKGWNNGNRKNDYK